MQTSVLGFPRIGPKREWKKSLEQFWKAAIDEETLYQQVNALEEQNWRQIQDAGIDWIPVGDFSLYDHVLDTACLVGAVPERFNAADQQANAAKAVDIDTYFCMARGVSGKLQAPALEMTKWFDTNYHYLVPELSAESRFAIRSQRLFERFERARQLGYNARPVLLGPYSFLRLSKGLTDSALIALLPSLTAVYAEIIERLHQLGATWVQIDEPCISADLNDEHFSSIAAQYQYLKQAQPAVSLLLCTYFADLSPVLAQLCSLAVDAVHLDLARAPQQLDVALACLGEDTILSLGLVNGRNIWRNDVQQSFSLIKRAQSKIGHDRLQISSSCSLLHCPYDLRFEQKLAAHIKDGLSFAVQKLGEIYDLGLGAKNQDHQDDLRQHWQTLQQQRSQHTDINRAAVRKRVQGVTAQDAVRRSAFAQRKRVQTAALQLPVFPTTSIGSFPQTKEIRASRARWLAGSLEDAVYEKQMQQHIAAVVQEQEAIGLDVLVHGEAERNDMVEYFGSLLDGMACTEFAWVQSYGSRCVKPPIIYGDVSRSQAMTLTWIAYAQSLTDKVMKGMLTGPVTILQWSFVREDQPRSETCKQIALAIRDEVCDLERAGIHVIQIDEPALREGLPLDVNQHASYLQWASECFRLSAAGVADSTQIHTHMCYCDFNHIIKHIASLDADVISIETSRSHMDLLDVFKQFAYPNDIGPGVWDIHSPRVPSVAEMTCLLERAVELIPAEQIWVNPDCGLKTRAWPEVRQSLLNMVEAAQRMRA